MLWVTVALGAPPPVRVPDGILPDPGVGAGGWWLDVDRDGELDLVAGLQMQELTVLTHTGATSSLVPPTEPVAYRYVSVDVLAPTPVRFGVMDEWRDTAGEWTSRFVEYETQADGAPTEVWSETGTFFEATFVGDMDGDGWSEVFEDLGWDPTAGDNRIRMSASGALTSAPRSMLGRDLQTVTPVGDLDGDGYADLVLGFSTDDEWGTSGEGDDYGHASLHLGSPDGLGPAVWRFQPSDELSAGRAVARVPGTDTLVFAVFQDREDRNGEAPSTLTVMEGASTPDYAITQRIPEPDWHGSAPTLAIVDDGDGIELVVMNGESASWYDWDPTTRQFGEAPAASFGSSACWTGWFSRPGGPVGMRGWEMDWPSTPTGLYTWGWEAAGSADTFVDGPCGFLPADPPADTVPSPGSSPPPPETPPDPRGPGQRRPGCGCGVGSGPAPLAAFAPLLAAVWRRRTAPRGGGGT